MKRKTMLRRMDDAIFQLQTIQIILSDAKHSPTSTKAAAELMEKPLSDLVDALETLSDKGAA